MSTTDLAPRTQREMRTVRAMIRIYCKGHHGHGAALCTDCESLWQYAQQRVQRCPFNPDKPTCANCTVHCYKKDMREQIRQVMRYAGPRMLWKHPVLAFLHLWDGRKKATDKGRP